MIFKRIMGSESCIKSMITIDAKAEKVSAMYIHKLRPVCAVNGLPSYENCTIYNNICIDCGLRKLR